MRRVPLGIVLYVAVVATVAGASGGAAVEVIRCLLSSAAMNKDAGPRKIVCKIPSPGGRPSCFTEKQ